MKDQDERMPTWVRWLVALAILEAGIIAMLVASKTTIKFQTQMTGQMAVQSPLELALEYESPDPKFEELVKVHSGWIPWRSPVSGFTILETCALLQKTNQIRVLITHGADVEAAAASLEKIGSDEAGKLLLEIAKARAKQ